MLTFGEVDGFIFALLGEHPAAPYDSKAIANLAGRLLFTMKPGGWEFTVPIPADLTLTAGTDTIALPSDFAALIAVRVRSNLAGDVRFVDFDTMADLRMSAGAGSALTLFLCLAHTPLSKTAAPIPQLEVWPPPSTTTVGALKCRYRQKWPELDADGDIIPIPDHVHALYLEIVRCVTLSHLEPEEFGMSLDEALRTHCTGLLNLAARFEGMQQPSIGMMPNQVPTGDLRYSDWFYVDRV